MEIINDNYSASLVAQRLNHLPAMWETRIRSLGWEVPLEKEMATHSSILAWRIPWMEEPGGLQSTGSQRVGHDWATSLSFFLSFFASVTNEWIFVEVWTVFGIVLFGIGMKTDLFQSYGHCWVLQICWHIECSTFMASYFRIWNSSAGILSPPITLFGVMLPKAHLTSHSRMSDFRWVITLSWLSESLGSFLHSSSVCSCHLFLISSASVRHILAWRIPGTREPGGLQSIGSHRVGHDSGDLAAVAAAWCWRKTLKIRRI